MNQRGRKPEPMLLRVLIVSLLAAGAGGCAALSVASDHRYPAYGNPVNPTPAPGYRVLCDNTSILPLTRCAQYIVPADVVVRTRG